MRSGGRIEALDGLRGVAILLVFLAHCYMFIKIMTPAAVPNGDIAGETLMRLLELGWSGVDLFFVLSGFLITGILLRTRDEPHYFRNFYARRALRILPLYYLFLVLYFFVLPVQADPSWKFNVDHQLWYWTLLQNIPISLENDPGGLLGIYWSLAIEEQFYLAWPLTVLLVPRRHLKWVAAGLIVVAVAVRLVFAAQHPVALYTFTLSRIDGIGFGSLLAILMTEEATARRLARAARWTLPLCAAGFFAALYAFGHFDGLAVPAIKKSMIQPYMHHYGLILLAGAFGSLLVLAVHRDGPRWLQRMLETPLLRKFGKHSYAAYITHLTVFAGLSQSGLHFDFFHRLVPWRFGAYLCVIVVYSTIALGVSIVLWHVLEKHFLPLKDRFRSVEERGSIVPAVQPA